MDRTLYPLLIYAGCEFLRPGAEAICYSAVVSSYQRGVVVGVIYSLFYYLFNSSSCFPVQSLVHGSICVCLCAHVRLCHRV